MASGFGVKVLLDSGNDVKPFLSTLDQTIGRSDGFQGYLRSWKEDVERHAHEPVSTTAQLREFTTGQVLSALPWYELLALVVTLIGALLAAVCIGYRRGADSGRWDDAADNSGCSGRPARGPPLNRSVRQCHGWHYPGNALPVPHGARTIQVDSAGSDLRSSGSAAETRPWPRFGPGVGRGWRTNRRSTGGPVHFGGDSPGAVRADPAATKPLRAEGRYPATHAEEACAQLIPTSWYA